MDGCVGLTVSASRKTQRTWGRSPITTIHHHAVILAIKPQALQIAGELGRFSESGHEGGAGQ